MPPTATPLSGETYELWTVDFNLGRVQSVYEAQTGVAATPVRMLDGSTTTQLWLSWEVRVATVHWQSLRVSAQVRPGPLQQSVARTGTGKVSSVCCVSTSCLPSRVVQLSASHNGSTLTS